MGENENWSVFCGLASCAIGGVFYIYLRNANKYLEILEEVPELEVNESLLEKVKDSGGKLSYVAVSGLVCANGKVIRSSHCKDVDGVIRNIQITEHKSKWSSVTKRWVEAKRAISSNWQTQAFSLISPTSNIKLNVLNPRDASKLKLETIVDKYEPINASWSDRLLDFIDSERVTGIQTIEKMLLVGSRLTIIGEIYFNDGGFHISAPPLGLFKYIITNETLEKVIKNEKEVVHLWKVFIAIFVTMGGAFFSYFIYKQFQKYLEKRHYWKCQKEMKEFNESIEADENTCAICLVEPRNVVCLPCGHVCSCKSCTEKVDKCPVCRVHIEKRSPIFYS